MISANMIITHKCNLSCKHCYLGNSINGSEASYNQIIEYAAILKDNGIKYLTLTGGEISTYSRIDDIIVALKKMGFSVGIFTNCLSITDTTLKHSDWINLSFDGSKMIHNQIRGNPRSFDSVIDTMNRISNLGKKISIQITISKLNMDNVESIIPILTQYQNIINKVYLAGAANIGHASENHIAMIDHEDVITNIKKKIQLETQFRFPIVDNVYYSTYKHAYFNTSTQFPLWIDAVMDFCFVATSRKILISEFTQEWYNIENSHLIKSIMEYEFPSVFIGDDIINQF